MGTDLSSSRPFASPEEAEQAFYDALEHADAMRVMQVWADDEEIACIHPGGLRAHGHRAVRESWQEVLAHGPLVIRPTRTIVLPSMLTVVHVLLEQITIDTPEGLQQTLCYATNVYHKGRSGWHMVLHHASPAPVDAQSLQAQDVPDLLH